MINLRMSKLHQRISETSSADGLVSDETRHHGDGSALDDAGICRCSDDDDATASTVDTESTSINHRSSAASKGPPRFLTTKSNSNSSLLSTTSSSSKFSAAGARSSSARTPPLKSALRTPKASKIASHASKGSSERRVRGLWNCSHVEVSESDTLQLQLPTVPANSSNSDLFESLQDHTLEHIVSFCSLGDRLNVAQLSRRFRHISDLASAWVEVDATDLIAAAGSSDNKSKSSPKFVADRVSALCRRHASTIESLTIRRAGNALSPEHLCLPKNLRRLELDGFTNLTDTLLHVLLLTLSMTDSSSHGPAVAIARSTSTCRLESVRLGHCPLLTDRTLRSISAQCPHLRTLHLEDCQGIQSLKPIGASFSRVNNNCSSAASTPSILQLDSTTTTPDNLYIPSTTSSSSKPNDSASPLLLSLFPSSPSPTLSSVPPTIPKPTLATPKPPATTSALFGLFSPPPQVPSTESHQQHSTSALPPPLIPSRSLESTTTSISAGSTTTAFSSSDCNNDNDRSSTPPRRRSSSSSESLSNLFLPPGQSPRHQKQSLRINHRPSMMSSNSAATGISSSTCGSNQGGCLDRLILVGMMSPAQVLDGLRNAQSNSGGGKLRIECLSVQSPSIRYWTRDELLELESLCDTTVADDVSWHLQVELDVLQQLPWALAQTIVVEIPSSTTCL